MAQLYSDRSVKINKVDIAIATGSKISDQLSVNVS